MRNIVVLTTSDDRLAAQSGQIQELHPVDIKGHKTRCGLVNTIEPPFHPSAAEFQDSVLIKVKAFSLNYRDIGVIEGVIQQSREGFYVIGSEFCGEVLECGRNVVSLKAGDRVMGNNHFTGGNPRAIPREALPTNHASKEYQIFHQAKLIKVPPDMPDVEAAAFSIGAQTVYSMLRKLEVKPGANVLVTAGRSNTALFSIAALQKHHVHISVLTTSDHFDEDFIKVGVSQVYKLSPEIKTLHEHEALKNFVRDTGGFDCVIDPFFDRYMEKVIPVMRAYGRYITCGQADQGNRPDQGQETNKDAPNLQKIMETAIVRNLFLLGNCLGITEDLECALADYTSGLLKVPVDSVFEDGEVAQFLDRTFHSKERFGKVVFRYT